jgi:hypothetical protein
MIMQKRTSFEVLALYKHYCHALTAPVSCRNAVCAEFHLSRPPLFVCEDVT